MSSRIDNLWRWLALSALVTAAMACSPVLDRLQQNQPDSCPDTCDGECTDLRSDSDNCGTCGNACPVGEQCRASGASGTPYCEPCAGEDPAFCLCNFGRYQDDYDAKRCSYVCLDLASSNYNCGACGVVCDNGEECISGECAPCGADPLTCKFECFDAATDPEHCGGCDFRCDADQRCSGSNCGACIGDGFEICGGRCVDTDVGYYTGSQILDCGACGNDCAIGSDCNAGICDCTDCNNQVGECADLANDANNCGVCGRQCTGQCTAGVCECPAGESDCGSPTGCVDLTNDINNCGECGLQCGGPCVDSMCTVPCDDSNPFCRPPG